MNSITAATAPAELSSHREWKVGDVLPDGRPAIVLDLYCRVSDVYEDGTTRVVDAMEDNGRRWVDANGHLGYRVGRVFKDPFLSGWDPKVVRPDFNAMVDRARAGQSHGVWVRDLDRYTRKMREAVDLADLGKAGYVVASNDVTYDLTTPHGLSAFYEAAKKAEVESMTTSKRSRRGMSNKVRQRGQSAATQRGFGREGWLPNPKGWHPGDARTRVSPGQLTNERQAIRDAADLLIAGGSLQTVANTWNEQGLLTVKGGRWINATVRQTLSSPGIAGLALARKVDPTDPDDTWHQVDSDPPLDKVTWDRLQINFASRKRGRPGTAYALSGLLFCDKCGSTMYGRPKTKGQYPLTGTPLDDDRQIRQYWCSLRSDGTGCAGISIDQREADREARAAVIAKLGDPRHGDRVAKVRARKATALAAAEQALSDLRNERQSILDKVKAGLWTADEAAVMVVPANTAIVEAEARVAALGPVDSDADSGEDDVAADWDRSTPAQRKMLVVKAFPQGLVCLPGPRPGRGNLTVWDGRVRIVPRGPQAVA